MNQYNAFYKGRPIFGPRGPAGPDGNPVGTVISYMGTTAPKDYIVCDGAEYNVADYPSLANHFQQQFGAANHFGGDGTTTFAVPDMRNLFLRGYHGGAEVQLSGDVGVRQEATHHYNVKIDKDLFILGWRYDGFPANCDSTLDTSIQRYGSIQNGLGSGVDGIYTSRPVNMAVLYCIKATESVPVENVYSTEETRIGTWVDGRPLYQKCILAESLSVPGNGGFAELISVESIGQVTIVNARWNGSLSHSAEKYFNGATREANGKLFIKNSFTEGTYTFGVTAIIEYTKTVD